MLFAKHCSLTCHQLKSSHLLKSRWGQTGHYKKVENWMWIFSPKKWNFCCTYEETKHLDKEKNPIENLNPFMIFSWLNLMVIRRAQHWFKNERSLITEFLISSIKRFLYFHNFIASFWHLNCNHLVKSEIRPTFFL